MQWRSRARPLGQWARVHRESRDGLAGSALGGTLFIEPGNPRENGYVESFNGTLCDELLSRKISSSLKETPVQIEMWRKHYNGVQPHSSMAIRPPRSRGDRRALLS